MAQLAIAETSQGSVRVLKWVGKGLFSHVGLFILVAAYCAGGAFLFMYLEESGVAQKRDEAINMSKAIEVQRELLAHDLWEYKWANNFNDTVAALVNEYHKNVTIMIGLTDAYVGKELKPNDLKDTWAFASALLFTITIVTTIGKC